jgi:hypothetical protein
VHVVHAGLCHVPKSVLLLLHGRESTESAAIAQIVCTIRHRPADSQTCNTQTISTIPITNLSVAFILPAAAPVARLANTFPWSSSFGFLRFWFLSLCYRIALIHYHHPLFRHLPFAGIKAAHASRRLKAQSVKWFERFGLGPLLGIEIRAEPFEAQIGEIGGVVPRVCSCLLKNAFLSPPTCPKSTAISLGY